MKTILPIALFLLFTLGACSKNQRQVRKIDGKWNVVEADIQGYGETDPDIIYKFEFCRLRQDEFCDFSIHNFDTDDIRTGIYSIDDRGTTLTLTISDGFGFLYREYTIERLSSRKLVFTNPNVPNGEFSRIVLRKVD